MSIYWRCKSLQSIHIPDSVISIGNHAFCWCTSLQSINIPDSVTSIGNDAFDRCNSLQIIRIPKGTRDKMLKLLSNQYKDKLIEE
ncbi:MAG: leucine-rich repeat domain-containing protein [Bacteroidaceae bacterium]|nr:leucine-rich repeat domain-containing protein [Bacteroidaceae bacterium]